MAADRPHAQRTTRERARRAKRNQRLAIAAVSVAGQEEFWGGESP